MGPLDGCPRCGRGVMVEVFVSRDAAAVLGAGWLRCDVCRWLCRACGCPTRWCVCEPPAEKVADHRCKGKGW